MFTSSLHRLTRRAGAAACLAIAIAAPWVHAAPAAAFLSAFAQFTAASTGDTAAIEPASQAFEALLQQEPNNPVLIAYVGACTAMKAATTMLPLRKLGYADDGLALLDKALAMLTPAHDAPIQRGTPGSLEVRFVAANTFLAVPGFMNRAARGSKLLNEVLASPLFAQSPVPFQGTVWLRAAVQARKEQHPDEARRYLDQIVAHQAPQAEQAQLMLKGLGS